MPEFAANLWVSGFSAKPSDVGAILGAIHAKSPSVAVQLVDLDRVPGSRYTLLAVLNALRSFNSKQPIAKTLSMEILLYMSANKQIEEAIRCTGISRTTRRVMAIVVGNGKDELTLSTQMLEESLGAKSEDEIVDQWSPDRMKKVQSAFNIGPKELNATLREDETKSNAIERLAIERSALLTIRK
jgi:tRNA threonylcarbamoyladenosine modification (KEOPS) complex Cgi121 subunit